MRTKKKIELIVNSRGGFYKAEKSNGRALTKIQVYRILGIQVLGGFRLEKYVEDYNKGNNRYEIDCFEINLE